MIPGAGLRIWLDDERAAPSGWMLEQHVPMALHFIKMGACAAISLDHDLGSANPYTGYTVLDTIERWLHDGTIAAWMVPDITVHTANPVARARMEQAVAAIHRFVDEAMGV